MPRHDPTLRLRDMLHHARKAHEKIVGVTREQFDEDEDLRTVVTWHLLIVGEAASRVEVEQQQKVPEIPWHRVIGMRHRLVHDYGNIDANIVWTTATDRIPELIAQLEQRLTQ